MPLPRTCTNPSAGNLGTLGLNSFVAGGVGEPSGAMSGQRLAPTRYPILNPFRATLVRTQAPGLLCLFQAPPPGSARSGRERDKRLPTDQRVPVGGRAPARARISSPQPPGRRGLLRSLPHRPAAGAAGQDRGTGQSAQPAARLRNYCPQRRDQPA